MWQFFATFSKVIFHPSDSRRTELFCRLFSLQKAADSGKLIKLYQQDGQPWH